MDRVADFFAEKTPRRLVAIAVFLTILYVFRSLAPVLVFFVMFERMLTSGSTHIAARTKAPPKLIVLGLILVFVGVLFGIGYLGFGRAMRAIPHMREEVPTWIAEAHDHPILQRIHEQLGGTEKMMEGAKHYASRALEAAEAVGHFLIHALIGFVLAIVFVLEREHIEHFYKTVAPRSLFGTITRWIGYLGEATIVTLQLQVIVAICNTAATLPLLFLLGIPHKGALMVLIFVSALIPVVGNLVSGVVLSLLAYQTKGAVGVGVFVALTFVLHKMESYYLNPRLTARHVHLPGFVLILSLIAFEHLFGFVGFFLSFPALFVAGRIRAEFLEEEGKLSIAKHGSEIPDKRKN